MTFLPGIEVVEVHVSDTFKVSDTCLPISRRFTSTKKKCYLNCQLKQRQADQFKILVVNSLRKK